MEKKGAYCYEYPRPALSSDCIIFLKTKYETCVLLIERAYEPFKGFWAFPGGFVDENETTFDAAKRELYEETGIKINSLIQLQTFSDVNRDPRGRVISVVYYSIIEKQVLLIPGDDAQQAKWFPISQIPPLAFDHAMILEFAKSRLDL